MRLQNIAIVIAMSVVGISVVGCGGGSAPKEKLSLVEQGVGVVCKVISWGTDEGDIVTMDNGRVYAVKGSFMKPASRHVGRPATKFTTRDGTMLLCTTTQCAKILAE